MNPFPPLFAAGWDAGDVIQIVIVFFIFVVPIISQLFKKIRQIPPPDQRPLPPRPAPLGVADEIEDFMHRAAQRKPIQAKRQSATAASPVVAEPVRAEVVHERLVAGQVDKHVETHINERKFDKREASLGRQVAQTGSELSQHLHQVFDHHVGSLGDVPNNAGESSSLKPPEVTTAEAPSLFITGLFDLLNNPDSIRQAIVLNEILRRPDERW